MKLTRKILLICLISLINVSVNAQDFFKTYKERDGLAGNKVNDIAIGSSDIFIGTDQGLSIFNNGSFTNYDTINSNLKSQNIKKVRSFNDTVWLVTDSGLSRLFSGDIFNYDSTNGLISNQITDIEVNSKGEVWIGSLSGLVIKRGQLFVHDSTKRVFDLGINKGDSVYANVNLPQITDSRTSLITVEIFDGQNWFIPQSRFDPLVEPDFINFSDGSIGLVSSNEGSFQIDSIFTLKTIFKNQISGIPISTLAKTSDTLYWGGSYVGSNLASALIQNKSGNINLYRRGLPSNRVNTIQSSRGKIYIGTDDGFAIANDSIKTLENRKSIETSSFKAIIGSNGTVFDIDLGNPDIEGFNFPKNRTNTSFINFAGLSFSSNLFGEQMLSLNDFIFNDFKSGPINSNYNVDLRESIFSISSQMISNHLQNFRDPNYLIPAEIRNWPAEGNEEEGEARGLAPFIDVNNNGCYDPEQGDYPFILGDQAVYFIYNDNSNLPISNITKNLNVEIHAMAYVFNQPAIDYIDQTLFIRYNIINRNNRTLTINAGLCASFNIGEFFDDYFGVEPSTSSMYAYNADDFDGVFQVQSRLLDTLPVVGAKVISEKIDGYLSFSNSSNDPRGFGIINSSSYYNLLKGRWKDGSPIAYGGNGYDPSSLDTTKFLYSGNPNNSNQWSQLYQIPNQLNTDNQTLGTSIMLLSPFTLKSGERKEVDVAFSIVHDSTSVNHLENVNLLIDNLTKAASFQKGIDSIAPRISYANCTVGSKEFITANKKNKILLYPNPVSTLLNLVSNEPIKEVLIFDLQGREIFRDQFAIQSPLYEISIKENWRNGLYLIRTTNAGGEIQTQKFLLQR